VKRYTNLKFRCEGITMKGTIMFEFFWSHKPEELES